MNAVCAVILTVISNFWSLRVHIFLICASLGVLPTFGRSDRPALRVARSQQAVVAD